MDLIFYFVYFVFGVLSLVLFFKIWGMTNDVERIQKKVCAQRGSAWVKIKHLILLGKTEEAYQELNACFLEQVEHIANRCPYNSKNDGFFVQNYTSDNSKRDGFFAKELDSAISLFKPWYDAIGKEIPSGLKELDAKRYIDFPPKY